MPENRKRTSLLCRLVLTTAFLALLTSCGGSGGGSSSNAPGSDPAPAPAPANLTAQDVGKIVQAAVTSVNVPIEVAVTDRLGRILAVYHTDNAPLMGVGNFSQMVNADELAVALARTGAFFSNNQAPLSSRTVRYISGIHFPPGINGAANAALYGIENTNRGCSFNVTYNPGKAIPPATLINGSSPGLGIITGKADVNDSQSFVVNPGGVPIFSNNVVVGGIGVVVAPDMDNNIAEYAAFKGSTVAPFGPTPPPPGVVTINGIALPFVNQTSAPSGITTGPLTGGYSVPPVDSPGPPPEQYLVGPTGSAYPGGLSASEVDAVVMSAVNTANVTRAAIRLPIGQRARMMISVADLDGNLLAIYRMTDATIFSIDVSVAKARNVVFFSSTAGQLPGAYANGPDGSTDLPGVPSATAVTNRTIGFGAQPLFPPGIDGSGPGPFFNLYLYDTANPCTQGSQPKNVNQNGIVFFPGALPLYRNGVLVGGLGVSGDGVDQDDFVTAGGAALMTLNDNTSADDAGHGFEAPTAIRADEVVIDNVRLPYIKFPRNPTQ